MPSTSSRSAPANRLESLSIPYLTRLARIATHDPKIEVTSWECQPVHGGFGSAVGGTALNRITVKTSSGRPCSLIQKILYERAGKVVQSPYYWKREYEVYRSGMLDNLPADSFSAPRIYGTEDFGDTCWIWMEDSEDIKDEWSLADFHNIALRLGRFNGAWLTQNPLPDYDWLGHNWHSAIVPPLADSFDELDRALEHPLVRVALPIDAKAEIESIWNDRQLFQDALARLPQTLCHIDAFRRNVLHRENDVVLLDWALASISGIGEELVCLVAVSLYYDKFSADFADRLDKTVFAGYIEGLRQAGWQGDSKLARIGFTCGMALRGLAGVKQDINVLMDAAKHQNLKQVHQSQSLEDIAGLFADVRRFRLLKMAREARELLSA